MTDNKEIPGQPGQPTEAEVRAIGAAGLEAVMTGQAVEQLAAVAKGRLVVVQAPEFLGDKNEDDEQYGAIADAIGRALPEGTRIVQFDAAGGRDTRPANREVAYSLGQAVENISVERAQLGGFKVDAMSRNEDPMGDFCGRITGHLGSNPDVAGKVVVSVVDSAMGELLGLPTSDGNNTFMLQGLKQAPDSQAGQPTAAFDFRAL
jgi:hypothetical protein